MLTFLLFITVLHTKLFTSIMQLDNNNNQTKEARLDRIFDFRGVANGAKAMSELGILTAHIFVGVIGHNRTALARFQSLMDDHDISDDDIIHALERAENRAVARVPQDFHIESDVSEISSLTSHGSARRESDGDSSRGSVNGSTSGSDVSSGILGSLPSTSSTSVSS